MSTPGTRVLYPEDCFVCHTYLKVLRRVIPFIVFGVMETISTLNRQSDNTNVSAYSSFSCFCAGFKPPNSPSR